MNAAYARRRPEPLAHWSAAERRSIQGVITDIDDTLTHEGQLMPQALAALHALRDAGIEVVAVTGRPVGWCLPFLGEGSQPPWPLKGIVAENGAVALQADGQGRVRRWYRTDEATRRAHHARLQAALQDVERTIPGAHRATDSAGRETDIAIDCREFRQLTEDQIHQVVGRLRSHGLTVTVSSIHVNAWIGDHDKWAGAVWCTELWLQRSLVEDLDAWVFVGDSSNDAVMFERMRHSVGVANVAAFLPVLAHPPRWICQRARGEGFAELAQAILDARGLIPPVRPD